VVVDAGPGVPECSPQLGLDANGCRPRCETPLAFVEIFGRSLLEHVIARLVTRDVEVVTLLVHSDAFVRIPTLRSSFSNIDIQVTDEVWAAVAMTLKEYSEGGIHHAFIAKPSAYTETDLLDLLDFHRQGHRAITRAFNHDGPLDLWIVSCTATWQATASCREAVDAVPTAASGTYFVGEYTKRISHLRDIRQLVTDSFLVRCQIRPSGQQIRPGVWAEERVGIGRGARIVAPAYLGRGCELAENTLVTRYSNIESFSYIDYGTAIEDTSVLPNTYVGIWLDVRHSVIQGNTLLNLTRNVMVEISDPSLIRFHETNRQEVRGSGVMCFV
jgi:NDP-sugar pyrophosphorylase family protein